MPRSTLRLATAGLLLAISLLAIAAQPAEVKMLVQSSPLAGFQYYKGREIWSELRLGDPVTLLRERSNPHDSNAVRVEWRGHMLGYIPRRDNRAVSRHMDGGGAVEARVSRLTTHRNPWQRIEFEVFVPL